MRNADIPNLLVQLVIYFHQFGSEVDCCFGHGFELVQVDDFGPHEVGYSIEVV